MNRMPSFKYCFVCLAATLCVPACTEHNAEVQPTCVTAGCLDNELCNERTGVCEPQPECINNDQCDNELVCRNQKCVPECTKDNECNGELICRNQKCVPECTQDNECDGELVCRNQKCVPECQTDQNCPDNLVCRNQKCVPECTHDDDCEGFLLCQNSICVPECINDFHCPGTSVCLEDHCVKCRDDDQCTENATCQNNTCVFECTEDSTCPTDKPFCHVHLCVECTEDAQCADHHYCEHNACVPECQEHTDCLARQSSGQTAFSLCSAQVCVECLDNSNCPTNQVCYDHVCAECQTNDADCDGTTDDRDACPNNPTLNASKQDCNFETDKDGNRVFLIYHATDLNRLREQLAERTTQDVFKVRLMNDINLIDAVDEVKNADFSPVNTYWEENVINIETLDPQTIVHDPKDADYTPYMIQTPTCTFDWEPIFLFKVDWDGNDKKILAVADGQTCSTESSLFATLSNANVHDLNLVYNVRGKATSWFAQNSQNSTIENISFVGDINLDMSLLDDPDAVVNDSSFHFAMLVSPTGINHNNNYKNIYYYGNVTLNGETENTDDLKELGSFTGFDGIFGLPEQCTIENVFFYVPDGVYSTNRSFFGIGNMLFSSHIKAVNINIPVLSMRNAQHLVNSDFRVSYAGIARYADNTRFSKLTHGENEPDSPAILIQIGKTYGTDAFYGLAESFMSEINGKAQLIYGDLNLDGRYYGVARAMNLSKYPYLPEDDPDQDAVFESMSIKANNITAASEYYGITSDASDITTNALTVQTDDISANDVTITTPDLHTDHFEVVAHDITAKKQFQFFQNISSPSLDHLRFTAHDIQTPIFRLTSIPDYSSSLNTKASNISITLNNIKTQSFYSLSTPGLTSISHVEITVNDTLYIDNGHFDGLVNPLYSQSLNMDHVDFSINHLFYDSPAPLNLLMERCDQDWTLDHIHFIIHDLLIPTGYTHPITLIDQMACHLNASAIEIDRIQDGALLGFNKVNSHTEINNVVLYANNFTTQSSPTAGLIYELASADIKLKSLFSAMRYRQYTKTDAETGYPTDLSEDLNLDNQVVQTMSNITDLLQYVGDLINSPETKLYKLNMDIQNVMGLRRDESDNTAASPMIIVNDYTYDDDGTNNVTNYTPLFVSFLPNATEIAVPIEANDVIPPESTLSGCKSTKDADCDSPWAPTLHTILEADGQIVRIPWIK